MVPWFQPTQSQTPKPTLGCDYEFDEFDNEFTGKPFFTPLLISYFFLSTFASFRCLVQQPKRAVLVPEPKREHANSESRYYSARVVVVAAEHRRDLDER